MGGGLLAHHPPLYRGMGKRVSHGYCILGDPKKDRSRPDDSTHKRCCCGTVKEFYKLVRIALTHLKTSFSHLKIGGPALANIKHREWLEGLLASIGDIKPDFISSHVCSATVERVQNDIRHVLRCASLRYEQYVQHRICGISHHAPMQHPVTVRDASLSVVSPKSRRKISCSGFLVYFFLYSEGMMPMCFLKKTEK